MLLRSILLLTPGTMLLAWANRLIHSGLSTGDSIIFILGVGLACPGLLFTCAGVIAGARALKEL